MSSSEFSLWVEHLPHPDEDLHRWAMLMAALHNGPVGKQGGGLWQAGDFLPQPVRKRKPKPASGASAKAFVARLKG